MVEPLLLCKIVLIAGLAIWLSVVVLNNASNFRGGTASIGLMMSMRTFEEPPAIQTPLLSRRVTSAKWHQLIFAFVLTIEVVVALALWVATLSLLGAVMGSVGAADATRAATFALAGLLLLVFIMAWGGAWFAYYIKQEGAQITHLVLMCVALAGVVVVNLPC